MLSRKGLWESAWRVRRALSSSVGEAHKEGFWSFALFLRWIHVCAHTDGGEGLGRWSWRR